MDARVLYLVLKKGYRVREIRRLLECRISKEVDDVCTRVILEQVEKRIEYVTDKALYLSRIRSDSPFDYSGPVFNLHFLGQYFRRSHRWGKAPSGVDAESQEEEDASGRPETFPYQLFVEDERDQPPPSPSPSLDPVQFQRLDEGLLYEVLKRCSAQKLCELIGGRGNKDFCKLCARALREVLREEILRVVKRALALDRLHRVQEVDHRLYWKCSSTRLRGFPAPVVPTSWYNWSYRAYRSYSGPGDTFWDWD